MTNEKAEIGQRIMIIGSPGSGKSTLAVKLGEITGLSVIHLDSKFWNAGWIETPKDEWRERQKELLKGDRWIVDGNYGGSLDIRLERADTVVFLDYRRGLCLFRVIKRCALNIGRTRPDMAEGCLEKIDLPFLKYVWRFNKGPRSRIIDKLNDYGGINVIALTRPREAEDFLATLH